MNCLRLVRLTRKYFQRLDSIPVSFIIEWLVIYLRVLLQISNSSVTHRSAYLSRRGRWDYSSSYHRTWQYEASWRRYSIAHSRFLPNLWSLHGSWSFQSGGKRLMHHSYFLRDRVIRWFHLFLPDYRNRWFQRFSDQGLSRPRSCDRVIWVWMPYRHSRWYKDLRFSLLHSWKKEKILGLPHSNNLRAWDRG